MNVLQSWLIVGIPGLVVLGALFVGRSPLRSALGYVALAALLVFFLIVPADTASAAAVGVVGALLVAAGRGGEIENEPEHHQDVKRFTTDPSAG
ncbi:MAG TPA: hypothetical protein VGA69_07830 [Nitriliruptorales bacterium]